MDKSARRTGCLSTTTRLGLRRRTIESAQVNSELSWFRWFSKFFLKFLTLRQLSFALIKDPAVETTAASTPDTAEFKITHDQMLSYDLVVTFEVGVSALDDAIRDVDYQLEDSAATRFPKVRIP